MALKVNDLHKFREQFSNKNIGVAFSCWDLLHAGHNLF